MQTHQPSELELEPQTASTVTEEHPVDPNGSTDAAAIAIEPARSMENGTTAATETGGGADPVSAVIGAPPAATETREPVEADRERAEELAERASDRGATLAGEPTDSVTAEVTGDAVSPETATAEAPRALVAEPETESAEPTIVSEQTDDTAPGMPAATVEAPADTVEAPVETVVAAADATAEAIPEPEAANLETSAEPATATTESEGATLEAEPEVKAAPNEGAINRLVAEVSAAPHKVYLLGKVRKAIAGAGESDLATRLRETESDILAQVAARTASKEALCERAEGLKDANSWKATGDAFKALFDEWKQVGAAGRELDDQLWARFNVARGAFNERRAKHFEEREQVWSANREQKEALCVEAEALADSTDWKATAEKIRDLQARWKAVGSAGREKDEALWARFNSAKQVFFDHRAETWNENRSRKEALVADAEALKESTDWRTTGDALKAMQAEWKTIGPAGREHEDELWTRFRAATQVFFDHRGSTFAERDKSERDNMAKKQEICARAEALVYTGDALSSAREAKDLQAQWKEIGPVPREQSEALWARFRHACDQIFENAHGERDRQQNEWHTRMRDALGRKRDQLNSLRESILHDEANIERWRESLSSLKPGGKSDEIGRGLEDKIIDVMNRIRDKQGRVEELRSSINDIEAKLKE